MVPSQLTVCGIAELQGFARSHVSHVLSILDPPPQPSPEAFGAFDRHQRLELRFHDVIDESQPQFAPPQQEHIENLLAFGEVMAAEQSPTHLLVHCHLGISRSTASMLLLLAQAQPRLSGKELAAQILSIRPIAWPNLRMVVMGDALLGRRGEIVSAARAIYKRRAMESPESVRFIREAGRLAELEGLDVA